MPRVVLLALLLSATPALAGLDVVFLIDTTGSMGGELAEAKDRVRQLAELLRVDRANQRVRIGVVAFRDQGDEYVTLRSPLDADVEVSFRFLAELTVGGGGDGPEDVLAGLSTAIHDMNWDLGDDVEREIFLIGDAPAHLDYSGHAAPAELIDEAVRARIVIHALGCRSLSKEGVDQFQQLAYATEGTYQHVGQVRVGKAGLASAMMNALKRAPGPVGALSGTPLELTVTAKRAENEGLAVFPLVDKAQTCAVRVSLPEGLTVTGAPSATSADHELELTVQVAPGTGGSWVFSLAHCLDVGTRIRLALRD